MSQGFYVSVIASLVVCVLAQAFINSRLREINTTVVGKCLAPVTYYVEPGKQA